jgi:hypothetical protein
MFGDSRSRQALGAVLAVLGVLAVIAGILYVSGTANSLHFLSGSIHQGHHEARASIAFVLGVVLLVGAWRAVRPRRSAPTS